MSSMGFDLPPPGNGQQVFYDVEGPKRIPLENCAAILSLLRKFYDAELLYPSSSKASQSDGRAHSVSSAGTNQTDMTRVFSIENFSAENGSEQRGEASKPLHPALRARKALMRKLGTCKANCRARKVQCKLYHHRLQDLLENNHSTENKNLVDWALQFDYLPKNDINSPSLPQSDPLPTGNTGPGLETIIDEVDSKFPDLGPQGEPQNLEMQIEDFNADASILSEELLSSPPGAIEVNDSSAAVRQAGTEPSIHPRTDLVGQQSDQFSTSRVSEMFPIGEQFQVVFQGTTWTHYGCCDVSECPKHFPSIAELLAHYRQEHSQFLDLDGDPRRVVCPSARCGEFHPQSTEICRQCLMRQPVIRIYGQRVPTIILTPWASPIVFDSKFGNPGRSTQSPGSNSQQSTRSEHSQDKSCGNGCPQPSQSSSFYRSSFIARAKEKTWVCLAYLIVPYRVLRERASHGRFATFVVLVLIIALLNFEMREWSITRLSRICPAIFQAAQFKEPISGALVMIIAFAMGRGILHVRSHLTSGCRRGRCPIRYAQNFRIACTGRGANEADTEQNHVNYHRRSVEAHEE